MHDIAIAALSVFLTQSLALLAPAPTPPAYRSAPLGARVSPWERGHLARLDTRWAPSPLAGGTPALPRGRPPIASDLLGETQNENF